MSKYHDDRSRASDPGCISLSLKRLMRLEGRQPEVRSWWKWLQVNSGGQFEEMLNEHLRLGDSRAACVMSVEPLLVAAYTDELDCIAMLSFPSWLAEEHGLSVGSRLLSVNTYMRGRGIAPDLVLGTHQLDRFTNFYPIIADFLSEEHQRIAQRKNEISEYEWDRCTRLGNEHLRTFPNRWRNGYPRYSSEPVL
jgi:hypothetical protein